MSHTEDNLGLSARRFTVTGGFVLDATRIALQTPEAVKMIEITNQLADDIRRTSRNVDSVEQLVYLEQALQQVDELSAQSEGDRASVKFARTDYAQLALIVQQMLHDPAGYIHANITIKETRADYRKQPKSRGPRQIRANKERLADRAAFSPKELRAVWLARMELADRTEALLRDLHDAVAAGHEQESPNAEA